MKQCPKCNRTFTDKTLSFCLEDGTLLSAEYGNDEETIATSAIPTEAQRGRPTNQEGVGPPPKSRVLTFSIVALIVLILGGTVFGVVGFLFYQRAKVKDVLSSGPASNSSPATDSPSEPSSAPLAGAEKARPTSSQQSIIDEGTETKWDEQGLSWRLPAGWMKMDVKKESFNYQSRDNAFLLVNISVLPDNFPMEVSLNASHDQALQQLKTGKYESIKLVEIDGITGVEFAEAMPENKSNPRRHQWVGYRTYLGQKQQLNVITSTKGTNFEKHSDEFPAILYSMKALK